MLDQRAPRLRVLQKGKNLFSHLGGADFVVCAALLPARFRSQTSKARHLSSHQKVTAYLKFPIAECLRRPGDASRCADAPSRRRQPPGSHFFRA